ncbi:MAG: hypothetical protein LBJ67_06725 [Planctomycetaceae bacterium]|jgi:hypothetical protein|nr:hypothetical protein [Planctomycetaceae bacterium]
MTKHLFLIALLLAIFTTFVVNTSSLLAMGYKHDFENERDRRQAAEAKSAREDAAFRTKAIVVIVVIGVIIFVLAVGHSYNKGFRSGGMVQALKDKLLFEQQGITCTIRENGNYIDLVIYKEDNISVKDTIHYTT